MELHWIETILYGLISGIAQLLPISSTAHKAIMLKLFGCAQDVPLVRLFAHIGCLAALLLYLRGHLTVLSKQAALKRIPPRRRKRFPDPRHISELALLKMAVVPVVIACLFYPVTIKWMGSLYLIAIFSVINGVVLLLPSRVASGNKDARGTSLLDRLLIGISAMLSVLPGVSLIGAITSVAVARGAEHEHAYRWGSLLLLPTMAAYTLWDAYFLLTAGAAITFLSFLAALLAGVAAFGGTWIAVAWLYARCQKSSIGGFGYYSMGAALFAFILYLI